MKFGLLSGFIGWESEIDDSARLEERMRENPSIAGVPS
jgi:hypothetical protein